MNGVTSMKFVCPSCERPIYNRRIKECEFCSASIPAELLFSDEEVDDLNNQQSVSLKKRINVSNNSSGVGFDYISTDFGDSGSCD